MARKLITLTNEFHGTEIKLRAEIVADGLELSRHQVQRSCRTLCGIPTCTCGGHLGERPTVQIMDGPRYDGSCKIVDEWV